MKTSIDTSDMCLQVYGNSEEGGSRLWNSESMGGKAFWNFRRQGGGGC